VHTHAYTQLDMERLQADDDRSASARMSRALCEDYEMGGTFPMPAVADPFGPTLETLIRLPREGAWLVYVTLNRGGTLVTTAMEWHALADRQEALRYAEAHGRAPMEPRECDEWAPRQAWLEAPTTSDETGGILPVWQLVGIVLCGGAISLGLLAYVTSRSRSTWCRRKTGVTSITTSSTSTQRAAASNREISMPSLSGENTAVVDVEKVAMSM